MKKLLAISLSLIACSAILTSCGANDDMDTNDTTPSTTAPIVTTPIVTTEGNNTTDNTGDANGYSRYGHDNFDRYGRGNVGRNVGDAIDDGLNGAERMFEDITR